MAGNPDQQEDTVDDQYQEDLEDEVCNPESVRYQKQVPVLQNIGSLVYCLHVEGSRGRG